VIEFCETSDLVEGRIARVATQAEFSTSGAIHTVSIALNEKIELTPQKGISSLGPHPAGVSPDAEIWSFLAFQMIGVADCLCIGHFACQ
jgi:hypothetical protein